MPSELFSRVAAYPQALPLRVPGSRNDSVYRSRYRHHVRLACHRVGFHSAQSEKVAVRLCFTDVFRRIAF